MMSKVHSFVFNKDLFSASGKESHTMHSGKQEEINWKILQFSTDNSGEPVDSNQALQQHYIICTSLQGPG